jgi:hypothetical protein
VTTETKYRFFTLVRRDVSAQAAALAVGVSPSCGSLGFIDAGRVDFLDKPINSRYLTQDDRIEIGDGLTAGAPTKPIAGRIGKSYQSIYQEIARDRKGAMVVTSRGSLTGTLISGGGGPGQASWPSMTSCAPQSRQSWVGIGRRDRPVFVLVIADLASSGFDLTAVLLGVQPALAGPSGRTRRPSWRRWRLEGRGEQVRQPGPRRDAVL